jgi:hypothetical protein
MKKYPPEVYEVLSRIEECTLYSPSVAAWMDQPPPDFIGPSLGRPDLVMPQQEHWLAICATEELVEYEEDAFCDGRLLQCTDLGRAVLALREKGEQHPEEVSLEERIAAVLTPNQGRIMEHLMKKRTASYDTLRTIPGAWRDEPSDEAITKQVKGIKTRLEEANLNVGYIKVSVAKRRVTIED